MITIDYNFESYQLKHDTAAPITIRIIITWSTANASALAASK